MKRIKEKTYLRIIDYILAQFRSSDTEFLNTVYSEQHLIQLLGVSRPTLREALRLLEFLGIAEVKPFPSSLRRRYFHAAVLPARL